MCGDTVVYYYFFYLRILPPPRWILTDTLFPYTTLVRSDDAPLGSRPLGALHAHRRADRGGRRQIVTARIPLVRSIAPVPDTPRTDAEDHRHHHPREPGAGPHRARPVALRQGRWPVRHVRRRRRRRRRRFDGDGDEIGRASRRDRVGR